MATPFVDGKFQAFTNAGFPLSGGKLATYAAGTLTPVATYTTALLSVANTNPVILDSAGRASVWLSPSTAYRMILKDAADVTIWDVDNISLDSSAGLFFLQSGTGAASRTVQARMRDTVHVGDFGAVGDGSTNDYPAISNAVAYLQTIGGGTLLFPAADYVLGTTLTIDGDAIRLVGMGGWADHTSTGVGATRLLITHTSGPGIRIKRTSCAVTDMVIAASGGRAGFGTAGTNDGIRCEPDDASESGAGRLYRTSGVQIERVRVTAHPNNGITIVGVSTKSRIVQFTADNNGTHGIGIGVATTRTNKSRNGQVTIEDGEVSRNGGHGICLGDVGTTVDVRPYRVSIRDVDSYFNATNAARRLVGSDWYIYGENHELVCNATNGESAAYDVLTGLTTLIGNGMYIAGRNIFVRNHRWVNCKTNCAVIANRAEVSTTDVYITSGYINLVTGYGVANYNPAFVIDSACRGVHIQNNTTESDVVTLASVGSINAQIDYQDTKRYDGQYVAGGFKSVAASLTLADQKAAYLGFSAITYGVAILSGDASSGTTSMLNFKCGTGAYLELMTNGTVVPLVNAVGPLANAGGTAGRLNISVDSATNRLYISNRTGSTQAYRITVLSTAGGLPDAAWVNL